MNLYKDNFNSVLSSILMIKIFIAFSEEEFPSESEDEDEVNVVSEG